MACRLGLYACVLSRAGATVMTVTGLLRAAALKPLSTQRRARPPEGLVLVHRPRSHTGRRYSAPPTDSQRILAGSKVLIYSPLFAGCSSSSGKRCCLMLAARASTAARACPTTSTVLARLAPHGLHMQSGEKPSWRSHAGFVAGDVDKSERYGDKSEMADEEVRERTARAPVACLLRCS